MKLPDINGKKVLIIGPPSSGKTYLSNLYCSHKVLHTDDYIKYGKESINRLFIDINKYDFTIVEGMLGYKLLYKGVKEDKYYPDIVIKLDIDYDKARAIYAKERNLSKFRKIAGYMSLHNKIFRDYQKLSNNKLPVLYKFNYGEYEI